LGDSSVPPPAVGRARLLLRRQDAENWQSMLELDILEPRPSCNELESNLNCRPGSWIFGFLESQSPSTHRPRTMFTAAMAPASVLRAARCPACTVWALRPFIGNFAGGARAHDRIPVPTSNFRRSKLAPTAAAVFSTFRPTPRRLGSPSIEERVEEQPSQDEDSAAPPPASSGSDVPWYLQVEPPRHPTLLRCRTSPTGRPS
jgi:hypothetical protein